MKLAPVFLLLALSGCGLKPLYSGGSSGVVAKTLSGIAVAPNRRKKRLAGSQCAH